MKNFVQAWSDKTQVRLGLHRNIVIIGVFRGEKTNIYKTRPWDGIFRVYSVTQFL